MKKKILLLLASLAFSANALDVSDKSRFVCKQGNCKNGEGIVWDAIFKTTMQGLWKNSKTIPGETYTVTVNLAPQKQFKQIYGQDGFLKSGEQPRNLGAMSSVIPSFRGEYTTVVHPFLRQGMAVLKNGVYDTGMGIEYRGRFEYLAAKPREYAALGSGFYIFYGDRVDTVENEIESGLFITDEIFAGIAPRFLKANPAHLAARQKKYQEDMSIAKTEFAQQAVEKKWKDTLLLIGKLSLTFATGGTAAAITQSAEMSEIAITLVNSIFNNDTESLKDLALKSIGQVITGDKELGNLLGKVVGEVIDEV